MSQGLQVWSQTAATNANADSAINWAEGMAPSAVNDSARAMMASLAKWRDDVNGTLVSTGSGTAYSVTSNQIAASLTAGYTITFTPNVTNTGPCTLNLDSLGAKPIHTSSGAALASGVLVFGTPYRLTYYSSNGGEWILHGFYDISYLIPIGVMADYVGSTAPNSNWVLPYGQAISRTTYNTLWGICGTAFGAGDGSTTFNVPDLRGRVTVGLDNMGGSAAGRITNAVSGIDATVVGANGGEQAHALTTAELAIHSHPLTYTAQHPVIIDAGTPGSQGFAAGSQTSVDLAGDIAVGNQGSGNTHNNLQPLVVVGKILRVA